jgi:hypothetical protein
MNATSKRRGNKNYGKERRRILNKIRTGPKAEHKQDNYINGT